MFWTRKVDTCGRSQWNSLENRVSLPMSLPRASLPGDQVVAWSPNKMTSRHMGSLVTSTIMVTSEILWYLMTSMNWVSRAPRGSRSQTFVRGGRVQVFDCNWISWRTPGLDTRTPEVTASYPRTPSECEWCRQAAAWGPWGPGQCLLNQHQRKLVVYSFFT